MKAFYQEDFTLAVIGGGQLGRMLLQACPDFALKTMVLDPSEHAPCRSLAGQFFQGSLTDFDSVYRFAKSASLVTIEIENVNVAALKQLEAEGIKVFPQPAVIEIIQDKRKQKQFYRDNNIPTADFLLTEDRKDVEKHTAFLPAFHKLGTGGYDGGGVQRLDGPEDVKLAFDKPGLLEKAVDVACELSVIAARNTRGEIKVYPPVECVFHPQYNLVDYLLAPSTVDQGIQDKAVAIAGQVVEALDIIGLLAVEMFVTAAGEVLVNEAAPRPHNSGHQTINANVTSQYQQHLRAILGLPLGVTDLIIPSAMVNLLGEEGYTGDVRYQGLEEALRIPGVNIFLYGKKQTRPKRKMGHITILDSDTDRLKQKVEQVKNIIKVLA